MPRPTLALRWLHRRRSDDAGEAGFTLIELVIACGVLALVLASLAYTGTMAFADAALSRHRSAAASLANEALEQVRALPYNKVALGLSTTDISTSGDSAITVTGGVYRFDGERIPNGNNDPVVPLVPHQAVRTLDDMDYTVSVYVTYLDDDPNSRALRVTVRASWSSPLRAGAQKFVDAQTVIYSPDTGGTGGCGSNATHPFAAPCQPFLYSNTSSGEGAISFSAFEGTALSGVDLGEATLYLPTQDTNMAIEQVQTASATARTSGVRLRRSSDGSDQSSGRSAVTAATDSDPSQPKPAHDSASVGPQASATVQLSGSGNSIQLTSSAGDTASVKATMAASGTNTCPNASNPQVNESDLEPCANGTSTQAGSMVAQLNLSGLGNATLAAVGNAAFSSSFSNRDIVGQATSCTTTSEDGCIHARHRSAIGTVNIGGLASALSPLAPLGFDYLVKLTGFSRTVTAEAGYGNANPSVLSSGVIQYWNGIGYTAINVASGASATIPVANVVVTNGITSTTIGMTAVLRTGGSTTGPCASPCASAEARAESPLVGDIRYTVVVGGTTIVDLNIHIDLGTLLARAEYDPGV